MINTMLNTMLHLARDEESVEEVELKEEPPPNSPPVSRRMSVPPECLTRRQTLSPNSTLTDFTIRSHDETSYLLKFLPDTVLNFVLQVPSSEPFEAPLKRKYHTVVMFADVSGFTRMSEKYSELGSLGTEQMAFNINRYFEQLVKIIRGDGGDIVKFAGDALFVIWQEDHEHAIQSAIFCALEIQSQLHNVEVVKGVYLSVKIGIGLGETCMVHLGGGIDNKYHYTVYGDGMVQALNAESHAEPGDTVLSIEAWNGVTTPKKFFTWSEADKKGKQAKHGKFIKISKGMRTQKKKGLKYDKAIETKAFDVMHRIERYIPIAVFATLKYRPWINENRSVCVMFINVEMNDMIQEINDDGLQLLQDIVCTVQDLIGDYGGYLNKFIFDDKGSTFLCVFGLPPNTNDDDCCRAVLCAMHIHEQLEEEFDHHTSIGIACGEVFCGLLGTTTYREYGVLSDVVNLSARLMSASKKVHGIYCSMEVMEYAQSCPNLEFELESSLMLKGKSHVVDVWSPHRSFLNKSRFNLSYWRRLQIHQDPRASRQSIAMNLGSREIVDDIARVTNQAILRDVGSIQLITGEKHVGLDLILANVEKYYENKHSLHFVYVVNVPYDFGIYSEWKAIFLSVLQNELRIFVFHLNFQQVIKRLVQNIAPELTHKVPALAPLVECALQDTEWSLEATEEEKLEALIEILCVIFNKVTELFPLLICISDLQYQYSDDCTLSRRMLEMVKARKLKSVHFIMTSVHLESYRNFGTYKKAKSFLIDLNAEQIPCDNFVHVDRWDRDETTRFLLTFFNVWSINEKVIEYLVIKCNGLCGLIIPFCNSIKGEFMLNDGELSCPLVEALIAKEERHDFETPTAIRRHFLQLIDTVSIEEAIMLKAASVICKGKGPLCLEFETDLLIQLYVFIRKEVEVEDIKMWIASLKQKGFLCADKSSKTGSFFICGLLLDTAYGMMLHRQQRRLHAELRNIYDSKLEKHSILVSGIQRASNSEGIQIEKVFHGHPAFANAHSVILNGGGSGRNSQRARNRTPSSGGSSDIHDGDGVDELLNDESNLQIEIECLDAHTKALRETRDNHMSFSEFDVDSLSASMNISDHGSYDNDEPLDLQYVIRAPSRVAAERKWKMGREGVLIVYLMGIQWNHSNVTDSEKCKKPNFYVALLDEKGHKSKEHKTSVEYGTFEPEWNEYITFNVKGKAIVNRTQSVATNLLKPATKRQKRKEGEYPVYQLQLRHSDTWKDFRFGRCELPMPDIYYLLASQVSTNRDSRDSKNLSTTAYLEKQLVLELNPKYSGFFDTPHQANMRKSGNEEVDDKVYLHVRISYVSHCGTMDHSDRHSSVVSLPVSGQNGQFDSSSVKSRKMVNLTPRASAF